MENKNIVINNIVDSINNTVSDIRDSLFKLTVDNTEINNGIIKTVYVQITALNSQITILQNELDNYRG